MDLDVLPVGNRRYNRLPACATAPVSGRFRLTAETALPTHWLPRMDRRVCIQLPSVGIYPELGRMLGSAFSDLGWRPTVRHRADAAALDQDLLVLVGLCRYIEGLPEVLGQRQGRKPTTVLWQLEPLPPVQLSPAGEAIGFRVAACDWGRLPRRVRRVLNGVVPFRTKLMRLARRWVARAYTRQVIHEPDHAGWGGYDVENYFNAMADWRWIRAAHASGWLDHCFATVQPRVRFLRSRGIAAEMLPVGYHPDWGRDRGLPRDIDVLFLGDIRRGRRADLVRWLGRQLAARGRTLTVVRKAHGADRESLLGRARIAVNLLRAPHDLAGVRLLMGMGCGALIVSEPCADTGAFEPGRHFVMAEVARLPEVIDEYLVDDEKRQAIAREGQRLVTEELTLTRVVSRMLQQVTACVWR